MPNPSVLTHAHCTSAARQPVAKPLLHALLLAGLISSSSASANWTNGQEATLVLGAANLTTAGGGPASASSFEYPADICTDPVSGKVFVVLMSQHRVLRFSAIQAVTNGGSAEAVLGQPDMNSTTANNGGRSARSLYNPLGCAIDAEGRLFVSDNLNQRVLRYDNAATKATYAPADGVLLQADYTSTGSPPAGLTVNSPRGLAIGGDGTLFVVESNNNRVLRFDNAASKSNGAEADGVLGAVDVSSPGVGGVTAAGLSGPWGVTLDAAGNLYVSDSINQRILRFDQAATKANGADADGVLGAPDFTTKGTVSPLSESNGGEFYDLAALPDGALYATDWDANRVLVYADAATKTDGAAADYVLGQSTFSSSTSGTTPSTLHRPFGLGYNPHGGFLMVGDASNNRIVGYYQDSLHLNSAPTASIVTLSGSAEVGQTLTGSYTYQDAEGDVEGSSTLVWKRGGTAISGADSLSYVVDAADVGQTLSFCVTPIASTGKTTGTEVCSTASASIQPAPTNTAPTASNVTISGSAMVGQSLTGTYSYTDAEGDAQGTSTFVWKLNGVAISGATSTSYTPVASDAAQALSFCVTPVATTGTTTGTEICSAATLGVALSVSEGPRAGAAITLAPAGANGWRLIEANTHTVANVGGTLPEGVRLPYGAVSLRLTQGTPGSAATVVLTYPEALPADAVYYKYGPQVQGGAAEWYVFDGAHISGNTVTLTLQDGALGDDDMTVNGSIQDPGGIGVMGASTTAIPSLGHIALVLLAGLMGWFGLGSLRQQRR